MNFIVDTIFCCITLNSFKSIMSLDALVKEKLYLQNAVLQVGTVYFGSDVYIITPEGITGCFPRMSVFYFLCYSVYLYFLTSLILFSLKA